MIWFTTLAVMGLVHISDDPSVLAAINPWYGIHFLLSHGTIGLVTLGAVFLAVTGGEALYADLGHFGRKPIQTAWLWFVFPSLVINYFGQGALVLRMPDTVENPFYLLAPALAELTLAHVARGAHPLHRPRARGRSLGFHYAEQRVSRRQDSCGSAYKSGRRESFRRAGAADFDNHVYEQ